MRRKAIIFLVLLLMVASGVMAKEGEGKYLNYSYSYIEKDGQYVFLFTPHLERNDTIVIGAMLTAIEEIDGKHQLVSLTPKTKTINNTTYIYFDGIKCDYYFLLYKEDSGKVYAFVMLKI